MAFTFRVEPAHALRIVTFAPQVTADSMRTSVAVLMASPLYDPAHDILVDLRDNVTFALDGDALADFARDFATAGGEAMRQTRLAVVVASDEQFGVARMYGAYRGQVSDRVQVFRDAADACQWLGVPRDVVP